MYDTIFELQMLRTIRPELFSYEPERGNTGIRRSRRSGPRRRLTTRRLFGLVPRFALARARST